MYRRITAELRRFVRADSRGAYFISLEDTGRVRARLGDRVVLWSTHERPVTLSDES